MRLRDKIAIVTGGASGIGRAIVLGFAREGAYVVVADIDEEGGLRTVQEVGGLGRKGLFVKTDVSRAADIKNLVDRTLSLFGRIDILVNNAALSANEPFLEATEE